MSKTAFFSKEVDEAWHRLLCASKTGIFPFSKGDTVGWDEYRHYKFINIGTVLGIITPKGPSGGAYCLEDGVYGFLRDTTISDFGIQIKPKIAPSIEHVCTSFYGHNICKLRSARVVLIEKIKKTDIYNNNE